MSSTEQNKNICKGAMNVEKIYKLMRGTGVTNIVLGIIILATGVTVGVMSIVSGSILLKRKSDLEF
jgi:hypothetical protein